ncbi:hypothetical protein G6708_07915 [Polynucleobacter paneuropaeus]|jgi:hypothetical protein|nr:hypothetical protein [Polynucleobacter paneuropaeus]
MLHRPLYRFLGHFLKKRDRRQIAAKTLFSDSFAYSLANARLVNSRSLLLSCDIHPEKPQSSIANTPYLNSIPSKIQIYPSGDFLSIYVPSDGLRYFAEHIGPQIFRPFILVSGDSDLPIESSTLGNGLDTLLAHPFLVAWYAQNRNADHPKLHSLPIGINLHNLWANPLQWGGGFILPAMQELQIETIAQQAPPLAKRIPKIFCNWHFSIDRADRQSCYEQIDHSLCYFQENPLPVAKTWEQQAQYQFVLSPHGAGLDCHRTWEALLLGCIPIAKEAKLNDLFTDLPVVVVHDWGEINDAFLSNALTKLNNKSFNLEKLSMAYWRQKIASATSL